jgi:hypothetical protein
MRDPGAVAAAVVAIGQRARRAALVDRARGEPAEAVIGVGDALAGDDVEPGTQLQAAKVVSLSAEFGAFSKLAP